MVAAAEDGLPSETGGILLGWHEDALIHVDVALEVPDRRSTRTTYERDHVAATEILAERLALEPAGSPLGYVGEWHSHPLPAGPSPQDFRTLAEIARRVASPVALIVLARSHDGTWTPQVRVTSGWRPRRAAIQNV